jgi:UDP-glucose 4-epimerase
MAVCLVIGGGGFIGSHLIEALHGADHVVRAVDNFVTGNLCNLADVLDAIELYPGDLSDRDFLHRVLCGVEVVFYLATPRAPAPQGEREGGTFSPPLDLIHVLAAARKANVRRFVYASSLRVYGMAGSLPCSECKPTQPTDPWGMAKLSEERACAVVGSLYGLETVRLRYFNVFGPRQPRDGPDAQLLLQVTDAMLSGRPPIIPGSPFAGQDLIFVDDAVHATLLAAETPRLAGKVYNIGRGRPTTAAEIVATTNSILNTRIEPRYSLCPVPALGPLADISRAEIDLGFCPITSLEQGLQHYLLPRVSKPRQSRGRT